MKKLVLLLTAVMMLSAAACQRTEAPAPTEKDGELAPMMMKSRLRKSPRDAKTLHKSDNAAANDTAEFQITTVKRAGRRWETCAK